MNEYLNREGALTPFTVKYADSDISNNFSRVEPDYGKKVSFTQNGLIQSLIDKQKKGFPLSQQEIKLVQDYNNGYIDINGNSTGKQRPFVSVKI